ALMQGMATPPPRHVQVGSRAPTDAQSYSSNSAVVQFEQGFTPLIKSVYGTPQLPFSGEQV
ncbi:MAG: hypothetical protein ACPLRM_06745, partial [Anaerolineae bacterium]